MNSTQTLTLGGATKRSKIVPFERTVTWDGLPDNAQEFIVRYGLKQYLADAMAGATEQSDAVAKVDARLAKLMSGDLSRTRGEGSDKPDTETGRALKLAKAAIRAKLKEANKTADKDAVNAAAQNLVDAQPKWLKEAKKQLEAEAAANAALAEEEGDDILADLLSGGEEEEEDDNQ